MGISERCSPYSVVSALVVSAVSVVSVVSVSASADSSVDSVSASAAFFLHIVLYKVLRQESLHRPLPS